MFQENMLSSNSSPNSNIVSNSLVKDLNKYSIHPVSKDSFYSKTAKLQQPQQLLNESNDAVPKPESRAGSLLSDKSARSLSINTKSDTDSINESKIINEIDATNSNFPFSTLIHSSSSSSSISIPTRKIVNSRAGSANSETLKSKRSNFQWTYDSDNYLLSLISNNQSEIFTRGNTCKTWELILNEFNEKYYSNILQTRTINNRFKSLMKDFKNRMQNQTFASNEDLNLIFNENEKLLHRLQSFIDWKKLRDGMKKRKVISKDPIQDPLVMSAIKSPLKEPCDANGEAGNNDMSLISELNDGNQVQYNNENSNNTSSNHNNGGNTNFHNSQISAELSLPTGEKDKHTFQFNQIQPISDPGQQAPINDNLLSGQVRYPLTQQFIPAPRDQLNSHNPTPLSNSRSPSRLEHISSPLVQQTPSIYNQQYPLMGQDTKTPKPEATEAPQSLQPVEMGVPANRQSMNQLNYNTSAINQLILLQNRQAEMMNKLQNDLDTFKKEQNAQFGKIMSKIDLGETNFNSKLSGLLELFLNKKEFDSNLMKYQKAFLNLNSQQQPFDGNENDTSEINTSNPSI